MYTRVYTFLVIAFMAFLTASESAMAIDSDIDLEELAWQVVDDNLDGENLLTIQEMSEERRLALVALVEEILAENDSDLDFAIPSDNGDVWFVYQPGLIIGGPSIDGCETILNYKYSNYSYHMPYSYWYRDEGWYDDLMLEYSYWTSDGKQRSKAFYISDYWLWLAMKNCGVAVAYEWMEDKKQRVTAVVGYSIWKVYGTSRVRYNTYLGFRAY